MSVSLGELLLINNHILTLHMHEFQAPPTTTISHVLEDLASCYTT
jgi:hypothetical protein